MLTNPISASLLNNYLGLRDSEGNVLVDKTVDFMETSKSELAEGLGLRADHIRADRLSPKAIEVLNQLAATLEFVAETFEGDLKKTKYWIKTPNLNFGGVSPRQLILRGKGQKVFQFVINAQRP